MAINVNEKLIYFGAGCGLGLLLGALFAPRSGQETRRNIGSKVEDLTQKVQEKLQSSSIRDTASQTWRNVVQKGRNVVSIGRQRLHESVEAGRRRVNESLGEGGLAERQGGV
jgi:gas vesicle protein